MRRLFYLLGSVALLPALLLLSVCRTERSVPSADPVCQASARRLPGGTIETPVMLSRQLRALATVYASVDSSFADNGDALFTRALDSASQSLKLIIRAGNSPENIVTAMNRCLFEQWGITFSDDRNNVRYLLPHLVWKEKKGSCVGMSLLYLLLAEKAGIPLFAVRAPSHLFIRYDNGRRRLNIETLRRGENMSEAWYRMRYSITDSTRFPLRNLDTSETAAIVAFNLGTICLNRQQYEGAIGFLGKAIAGMPDFPEAQGNLALAYEAAGDVRRALRLLLDVQYAYPLLDNIDRMVASLQLKSGNYRKALASFDVACEKGRDDPDAHYGRALTLIRLKRNNEACAALDRAIRLRPGFSDAERVLSELRE